MKKNILFMLAGTFLFVACKKTTEPIRTFSSLITVNATTDVANAKVYASADLVPWRMLPAADASAQYRSVQQSVVAGPAYVNAVSNADTTILLYGSGEKKEFKERSLNTLFLFGKTGDYKNLLIMNDNIVNQHDSVVSIRFMNSSPNSAPVNIVLSSSPSVKEVTALEYGKISGFKLYPALQSTGNIVFQVTDAGGAVLAAYTLPVTQVSPYPTVSIPLARFKNLTLIVKGLQGTTTGDNAFGIFPVPHY